MLQAEHASAAPTPKRSRTAQASAQSDAAAAEATDQQIEAQMRQVAHLPSVQLALLYNALTCMLSVPCEETNTGIHQHMTCFGV